MTGVRARGEQIRRYILDQVEQSSVDVTRATANHFGITRQAVNKHLRRLVNEGLILRSGLTSASVYRLAPTVEWSYECEIEPGLAEDVVWTREVRDVLGEIPDNVMDIWQYGFNEMFNNAIDHSEGTTIGVQVPARARFGLGRHPRLARPVEAKGWMVGRAPRRQRRWSR